MSDKDHKRPSFLSSLRRSFGVHGIPVEETRPMLSSAPRNAVPVRAAGPPRPGGRVPDNRNFEISLRDKSDATAKRGFWVQVPKRMLSYALLVFVVLPLVLFFYVEVHNVGSHRHGHGHEQPKAPESHFTASVFSHLLDVEDGEGEEDATLKSANGTVADAQVDISDASKVTTEDEPNKVEETEKGADSGNTTDTSLEDATKLNSTMEATESEGSAVNAVVKEGTTDAGDKPIDVETGNQTKSDEEKPPTESGTPEEGTAPADPVAGVRRFLQSWRQR